MGPPTMRNFFLGIVGILSCFHQVLGQGDDLFKLMMMSSLFSGGGLFGGTGGLFGGGGGGGLGTGTGTGTMQNNIGLTGFEADPTAGRGSGSSTGSSPGGGLFGGLMGLLSRGAGGSAPLLLDVDGDILRQLGQNGQGGPNPGVPRTGSGTNSVNVRTDGAGQVGSPMVGSGSGSTGGGRPKSMPFELEFTGSNIGQPAQLEGNMASAGSSVHEVVHPSPDKTGSPATP